MFPRGAAILGVDEGNQLLIRKRDGLAALQRAVKRHLQGVGHVLNGFTICDLELAVCRIGIHTECLIDHRVIKGMDRAFEVRDHLDCRRDHLFTGGLKVSSRGVACDGAVIIYRKIHGYLPIGRDHDILLTAEFLNRRVIRPRFGLIAVNRIISVEIHNLGGGYDRQRHRLIPVIGDRDQMLMLFPLACHWEHGVRYTPELCHHVLFGGVLLFHRRRVGGQNIAGVVSGRAVSVVDEGIHGELVITSAFLNQAVHPGER